MYGRQLPLSYTGDDDKRDLLITFGQDRKIQVKDYFFHNANSMLPRFIWNKFPFDESLTNIEDRAWAKLVIDAGYKIIYEPDASVYHYHGLHQHGSSSKRSKGIATILDKLDEEDIGDLPSSLKPENIFVKIGIIAKNISEEKTAMSGGQFYLMDEKDQRHKAVFGEFSAKDLWLVGLDPGNPIEVTTQFDIAFDEDKKYKVVIRPQKDQSTVDTASICLTNCWSRNHKKQKRCQILL